MSSPNPLELARQGNPRAIAFLINRSLQPKGITAKANVKGDCLQVLLEAVEVPDQQILAPYVLKGVRGLEIEPIQKLIVYGRKQGETNPFWTQEFELKDEPKPDVLEEVTPILDSTVADKEPETADKKPETADKKPETADTGTSLLGCFLLLALVAGLIYFIGWTLGGIFTDGVTESGSNKTVIESSPSSNRVYSTKISDFEAKLKEIDPDRAIVAGVDSSNIDGEAVITVTNSWHYQPYQTRLQAAQNLWKVWATLASPDKPDRARIKLVDLNGNRVGGSSWLAGSVIDVSK
jgi:hypothetical protein